MYVDVRPWTVGHAASFAHAAASSCGGNHCRGLVVQGKPSPRGVREACGQDGGGGAQYRLLYGAEGWFVRAQRARQGRVKLW
jgi:hypothetical protein